MELTEVQIYVIGVVASLLTVAIKFVAAKFGKQLSKGWLTIIVGLVSMVLAVLFNIPALPVYTDPIQFIGAWLALASGYVGAATLIYNLILDKVLDALNLTVDRFLKG